ncbi:MAG: hypothetical protein ACI8ZX_000866 [Planctomycetota bacterium]|jgi:hypothetical protein
MNIVFVIGNGFDINLSLNTRYSDFYEVYKNTASKNDSIKKLKKNISKSIENWSDLELALGQYTNEIKTKGEFIDVFEDIGDNLADYLLKEESKLDISNIDQEKLFKYLSYPENYLTKAQKDKITLFRETWHNMHWHINVITLNYTNSFETIIKKPINELKIGDHHNAYIYYQGIQHLHGYMDNRMVLGVNDISQIKNESFHNMDEVLDAFVKNNCNIAMQHDIDKICSENIYRANLICIFGSSIGETDKLWWENIGTSLLGNCSLIIFEKRELIPDRRSYKKKEFREDIKNSFLNKTSLNEEQKKEVFDKIFVGINTKLFDGIQKKK